MKFLADMGVSRRAATWLREQGHDVCHLQEEGQHTLPDGAIFSKAETENRVVLTFDLDFGEIIALSGRHRVSVVVFRLNNTRTEFLVQRLRSVLESTREALQRGAIVVVEDSRHRVRRLPLGS